MKWQRLIHQPCQPLQLHVCVCVCTCELSASNPNLSALKEQKSSLHHTEQPHTRIHKVHSGSALERSAALGQVIRRPPRRRMFHASGEDMWVGHLQFQQYHCTSQKPCGTKLPAIFAADGSLCAGFDLLTLHDDGDSCNLELQPKQKAPCYQQKNDSNYIQLQLTFIVSVALYPWVCFVFLVTTSQRNLVAPRVFG